MTPDEDARRAVRTYVVDVTVQLGSKAALDRFQSRFCARAQRDGTVQVLTRSVKQRGFEYVIIARYAHTCRNDGNAYSDARRFVASAMRSTKKDPCTHRYSCRVDRVRRRAS